ncbi:IGS10 protein, partial [Cercotrichas coryphoeus]|nr:IGS10 protein [Cercotrichas coryphoeus]
ADGRLAVLSSGVLALRAADVFDSGLYRCIAANQQDADVLAFRVTVLEPRVQRQGVNGARLAAALGSTLHLPCSATAAPEPALTWVLPEHTVLRHSAGNKRLLANGTLRIQGLTERDAGYYRCVAANRYGADLLVFQVLVRHDGTALKERQGALGEHPLHPSATQAAPGGSAAAQRHPLHPSATLPAPGGSAAAAASSQGTRSARQRNSHGKMPHWPHGDRAGRRFRGHRRQFVSSARRVDPQRWAALLEKTKRNLTGTDKRGEVATEPPMQVHKLSEVPEHEEETSGDLVSPEEEFMTAATERSPVSALGTAAELPVTAGPEGTASAPPAWSSSLLLTEPSPLPSPPPHPVAPASKRPQALPKPTDSWERPDLSQISANGVKQSAVPSGTFTLFPAGQKSIYSGESNKQHLRSASMTPTAEATGTSKAVTPQNTDKLHIFTEPIDNVSTKTDHQVPVATVNAPSSEFGPISFHSTQKGATPNPPLASTLAAHQQIQIIQDVPTHPPQLQQHPGRRRKISGRRRIVRPGRVPSMREHRYNFGRPGSARGGTAVATGVRLNMNSVSNVPALNNLSSSMDPSSPEAPQSSPSSMDMALEHPVGTRQNTALLREEEKRHSARQKAATTVTSVPARDTASTAARGLRAMGLRPTVTLVTAPQTDTRATKSKILRAGGRRGQRRKRPPKTAAPQRGAAAHSNAGSRATPAAHSNAGSRATPAMITATPAASTATTAMITATPAVSRATPAVSTASPVVSTATPAAHSNAGSRATPTASTATPTASTASPAVSTATSAVSTATPAAHSSAGSRATTAAHSSAATPAASTATPAVTALTSPAVPLSLAPAKPLAGSTSAGSMTKAAALGAPHSPEPAQHRPRAATQTPAVSPATQRDTQLATSPAASPAQSPPTAPQSSPWPEQPPGATSAPPAAASATPQHTRAAATAGGKGAAQEQQGAEPPAPARAGPGAPAAATAPRARHPSPLP